jgi:hypothetical protein
LSKGSPEPAYTVEPVREKNNKYFILRKKHFLFLKADTLRAIAVPAKSEGGRSGTLLAT